LVRILNVMARRMFVALYPPQSVVDELASVLAEVKQVTPGAEAIRWSRPSQWHLTLAFLPKVPDEYLSRIGAALALLAETWEAGPPLAVSGAGKFGTATLWWALRPDPVAERWLSQWGARFAVVAAARGRKRRTPGGVRTSRLAASEETRQPVLRGHGPRRSKTLDQRNGHRRNWCL